MGVRNKRHKLVEMRSILQAALAIASKRFEGGSPLYGSHALLVTVCGIRFVIAADGRWGDWDHGVLIDIDAGRVVDAYCIDGMNGDAVNEMIRHDIVDWIDKGDESLPRKGLGKIDLPIVGDGKRYRTEFDCSCCGEWFQGDLDECIKHDQDHGHAYCPSCIHQFHLDVRLPA